MLTDSSVWSACILKRKEARLPCISHAGWYVYGPERSPVSCLTGGRLWRDVCGLCSTAQPIIKVDVLAGPTLYHSVVAFLLYMLKPSASVGAKLV